MGFFEDFAEENGGNSVYLSSAEKDAIIEDRTPFVITDVADDDENEYKGKPNPRYVLTVDIAGEERKFGLAKVADSSRDLMLVSMQDRLAAGGTIPPARLELRGQFQVIVPA